MRILICIYRDCESSGGSFRVAEVLVRSLLKQSIDVYVAVAYGDGARLQDFLGERCHLLGAAGRKDIRAWIRYRRLVSKLKPQIIHYVDGCAWMIAAAMGLGPKRIMHQHCRPDIGPNGQRRLGRIRWLAGSADKVIAISHGAGRQLAELCGVSPHKIAVVHNAIDGDYLTEKRQLDKSIKRLGMAARIVPDKGFEDALTLLQILPDHFRLTIAGSGPALPELRQLANERDLSDRVEWLGLLPDISRFYTGIDYYLFMSWYEGFGLSVAEAMASGVPVVGLLGDGEIAEAEYPLVTSGNSRLVPRSCRAAFGIETADRVFLELRKEILHLDENPAEREETVRIAKRWVQKKFTSSIYSEKILNVYRTTLGHL